MELKHFDFGETNFKIDMEAFVFHNMHSSVPVSWGKQLQTGLKRIRAGRGRLHYLQSLELPSENNTILKTHKHF